ncbi:hypothetical protein BpHYR1_027458 [Brachionus plicatilis]|uniref:Uncharacterized protein n=1 Tax=Brachionus plicatilis TaxID=10195 RepID=A0A3M7Q4K8_BRAPC|nr:hypothetical protein BpHYR1_027458 [Brachionus plicatilis]
MGQIIKIYSKNTICFSKSISLKRAQLMESYSISPLNKTNPSPSPNSRPLLSASNLNKIYSNTSNQSSRSPQYNLLATRPDHSSSRTTSSDGTSATSIHQQRTRPYTPRSNISIIPDNRSGRIKKETNL